MNKTELIQAIARQSGIGQQKSARVLEAFTEVVTQQLTEHEKVSIKGFGTFEVKARAARTGRNPRTNEAVQIPESAVPVFRPSPLLRGGVKLEPAQPEPDGF